MLDGLLFWVVNISNGECRTYKTHIKKLLLCKLFCVQSSIKVSITFFSFPTNILSNKVKQVCNKIIFINSLFIIYYDFSKVFNIVGHHEKSCKLKQLLFLRFYLSVDLQTRLVGDWIEFVESTNSSTFSVRRLFWHHWPFI